MLIVSKYKDYYDTVQSLGVDKTCVYNRTEVDIELDYDFFKSLRTGKKVGKLPFMVPTYEIIDNVYYYFFVIGFCGKIYYGYEWTDPKTYATMVSYDLDSLDERLKRKKSFRWSMRWAEFNLSDVRKEEGKRFDDFFIQHGAPIFIVRNKRVTHRHSDILTLNPKLKDFGFVKIKDVYTAYQEVYSYLSGVLGTKEKETVEVSERDKLLGKGFDPKWSFRNPEPPKRKRK